MSELKPGMCCFILHSDLSMPETMHCRKPTKYKMVWDGGEVNSRKVRKYEPFCEEHSKPLKEITLLEYDWRKTYTVKDAEYDLTGFEFNGPGWYFTDTETMLVVPHDRSIDKWWHQRTDPNEVFTFYVWDNRSPIDAINAIVNAPTRQDER